MIKPFSWMLEYYVVTYLRQEAGMSQESLRSYYTAIEQYIQWLSKSHGINIEYIDTVCFTKEYIKEFLSYIENEKMVSASTRNQRKAGIIAFLKFAADVNPVYSNVYIEAKTIRAKKSPKPNRMFLTIDEYKSILEFVDISNDIGFKHYILINVMYDTGARVNEIVLMNIEDFSFGHENSVVVFGKGSKYRRIYLTKHTVMLIKEYQKRFNIESGALFKNRCGTRISDSGIDYILKKYSKLASTKEKTLERKTVSPHILRKSKATHMLLNGASLPVIQRFLGHESIQTTEAYLVVGSESMIKAVEEAGNLIFKEEPSESAPKWKDQDILKKLKEIAR